jgi:hypothetical protein
LAPENFAADPKIKAVVADMGGMVLADGFGAVVSSTHSISNFFLTIRLSLWWAPDIGGLGAAR